MHKPVQAIRTTTASGTQSPVQIDAAVLFGTSTPSRAMLRLRRDVKGGEVLWEEKISGDATSIALPPLPAGRFDLTVDTFDTQGALLSWNRYFLNIWESPVNGPLPSPSAPSASLLLRATDDGVAVSGFGPSPEGKDAILHLTASVLGTGVVLETIEQPMTGLSAPWLVPLKSLQPGRALLVEALLTANGRVIDRDEIWTGKPGETPAGLSFPPGPKLRLTDLPGGESVSTIGVFHHEEAGFRAMLAGMKARGSNVVQIGITWDQIEPIEGVFDWSNLDAYVACLTETKTPFILAHIASNIFNRTPIDICGDWMVDDRNRTGLWRNTEIMSPVSPAYLKAAADFTRRLISRYKTNPYLVGYEFINHGEDSGLFFDDRKSVTDYSPVARDDLRAFLKGHYSDLAALNAAWGSNFTDWETVEPPLPQWEKEADLSAAWLDWTAWKLDVCQRTITGLFNPIVQELDPERAVLDYAAYIGPFETLLPDMTPNWWLLDGGGEDPRMGRVNSLSRAWGVRRQSESHEVPPANLNYQMDLLGQSLRNGADQIRYNLVWNSLPSGNLVAYPANAALQKTLAVWSRAAGALRTIDGAVASDGGLAIVLSWDDMLDRQKIFRWFTIPGDRADILARSSGHASASWLSDWSPDAAWAAVHTVLVPEDARVWSRPLEDHLKAFVEKGGHLVLWGRAGQYTPDDGGKSFAWLDRWQAPLPEARPLAPPSSQQSQEATSCVAFSSIAAERIVARDSRGNPLVISWKQGEGTVLWCLSDTPGQSEKIIARALAEEAKPEVLCSDPRVEGFLLRHADRTFLVVDWFQGYNAKALDGPTAIHILLPGFAGQTLQVHPLFLSASGGEGDIRLSLGEAADPGLPLTLTPSDLRIYEIVSDPPNVP